MGIGFGFGFGFAVGGKGLIGSNVNPFEDEYNLILAAMTTEPSYADKINQNKLVKDLKDAGLWSKGELFDMFSVHADDSALINWINPGTFNPAINGTPRFLQYAGYLPNPTSNVRLNYTPSINSIKVGQDDITVIIAIGENTAYIVDDFGSFSGNNLGRLSIRSKHTDSISYHRVNSKAYGGIANTDAVKYYTIRRVASGTFDVFLNKTKSGFAGTSDALSSKELYAGGSNEDDVIKYSNRSIRFVWMSTALSDSEVETFIDKMEIYLKNYYTNIIDYANHVAIINPASRTQIPLTTYDGGGETIHPSVVDCGADWNGYRYWMANTPYPGSNSAYENPSLWASADGITWIVPVGLVNPIVSQPVSGYNADTFIYFEAGIMYVFYKEVSNSIRTIKVTKSTDGLTWSTPTVCLSTADDESECVSPSVIKLDNIYYMYFGKYVTISTNEFGIRRASCNTIDGLYSTRTDINVQSDQYIDNYIYWHTDVKIINNKIYMSAVSTTSTAPRYKVFILISTDGINFKKSIYANIDTSVLYYRASLAEINGDVKLYISNKIDNKWGLEMFDVALI